MGATRESRTSDHVAYRFPDGARRLVPTNIAPGRARQMLAETQERYGTGRYRANTDPLRSAIEKPGAPVVDTARLALSRHARERFELMADQANLRALELRDAVQYPERVLWSPMHCSWLWVRGRIIVAVVIGDDGAFVIRTLLWATEELWEQNPRPEPEAEPA